ncbi:hypothetical protein BpHYR1_041744 [Brachionus plicatilis]|uniref:Uncharacterized protein n=1 Tax=Brachionus plicatilis TaxID=10195 RepID=A0A3M7SFK1_BRAPC|nr:hypothetical protein BpHYR1_041744 [Brachionus plicatilis]
MTGISRIAVVVGLGINCCAYAQGFTSKSLLFNSYFDLFFYLLRLFSIIDLKMMEVSEKLARTFLTVKLNFITPLIFVMNAFILFLIFVLKKKSFCAQRFEIVLNEIKKV